MRYLDPAEVKASYWKKGRMSQGLLRARRQYRTKNALVGGALLAFVVGVFTYAVAAVKQDTFDDLDDAARERAVHDARRAALSVDDEKEAMRRAAAMGGPPRPPTLGARDAAAAPTPASAVPPRGILAPLLASRVPWLLDPTRKTLVWGAPPIDNIGKLGDPVPSSSADEWRRRRL
ncbi:hypothetical protein B0H15DRAFT_792363 [Mycena belliarum]|uniref:Cytochrome c oxidase assembly factor 3 n=1 Tax=Mycena belliarum TaxID=1033014 RepID=A0AAD6XEU4_9AGAR|nr:hypothetical protein B0H15DRAFT_792363 [Mycena belliae]